ADAVTELIQFACTWRTERMLMRGHVIMVRMGDKPTWLPATNIHGQVSAREPQAAVVVEHARSFRKRTIRQSRGRHSLLFTMLSETVFLGGRSTPYVSVFQVCAVSLPAAEIPAAFQARSKLLPHSLTIPARRSPSK